MVYIELISYTL